MAQLVASMSGVVLGGVVMVVGSNLARDKIFTASLGSVESFCLSLFVYCMNRHQFLILSSLKAMVSSIQKEPIYDVYCICRRKYQRFLNILFGDVSVAQLMASTSGVVLGGVVMVVGSNLARGKIFTAPIGSVDSLSLSLS